MAKSPLPLTSDQPPTTILPSACRVGAQVREAPFPPHAGPPPAHVFAVPLHRDPEANIGLCPKGGGRSALEEGEPRRFVDPVEDHRRTAGADAGASRALRAG